MLNRPCCSHTLVLAHPNPSCSDMYTHGVNIGQALKSEALWFRRSQDDDDAASTYIRLAKLDKYHGAPSGMFMADEHLAGAIPSHGTEVGGGGFGCRGGVHTHWQRLVTNLLLRTPISLCSRPIQTCAVVEAVVSLAVAGLTLGDASLFERAEKVAYNALPASMTKDMCVLLLHVAH